MYVDVVNAAQREAGSHGYFLLIDADEAATDPRLFREVVVARRVDGLLLQGGFGGAADALVPYADLLPSVFFNSSGATSSPGVRLQDVAAAPLADLGTVAVRTLIQKIESSVPRDVLLPQPPELVLRESTASV